MSLKPKPSRLRLQPVHLTPLLSRGTGKPTSNSSLFASTRPGLRLNASQKSLSVSPLNTNADLGRSKGKVPIRIVVHADPNPTVVPPQFLNRRLSMPEFAELALPKIRPRAASNPEIVTQEERSPIVRFVTPSAFRSELKRCYYMSQAGSVHGKVKANNQDSHFYVTSLVPGAEMTIMGVCDGHGESGHFVSGMVSKRLPSVIRETFVHYRGRTADLWPTVLVESFKKVSGDLSRQAFDSTYSGSTCVTVVFTGNMLLCANVGDSRAVLGRRDGSSFIAVPLSRDHKPDVEEEKQRILDFGGRVEAIRVDGEDIGPLRVWLKSEDVPGLAMTRAMGDTVASRVGVISTPEITIQSLSPEDAFVIVASDGIWEFISSQEAVDLVARYSQQGRLEECCQALVAKATKRWRREEQCVDDITVLVAEIGTCP